MSETGKNYLKKLLGQALKELGFSLAEIQISQPEAKFGDYSTNAALIIGKKEKKNPKEVAEKIIEKLQSLDPGSRMHPGTTQGTGHGSSGMTAGGGGLFSEISEARGVL